MSLTKDEVAAVAAYSGTGYKRINAALRTGKGMDDDLRKTIDLVDSAIAKSPVTRRLTVYRGVAEEYASKSWICKRQIRSASPAL